jgi:two-component system, response regulator PdtaR
MDTQPAPVVLVVEDETFTRMDAVDAISDAGLETFEAGDACEALDVLEGHPQVTVLFTDISMPGPMDGLALAARVHDLRPDVELILTSGARKIPEEEMPDNGTFLPKPYGSQQLITLINRKAHEA